MSKHIDSEKIARAFATLDIHDYGDACYVSNFLGGEGLTKGNPLIACAPGVKDALISAVEIEGIVL